jgi:hypothetical protein
MKGCNRFFLHPFKSATLLYTAAGRYLIRQVFWLSRLCSRLPVARQGNSGMFAFNETAWMTWVKKAETLGDRLSPASLTADDCQ